MEDILISSLSGSIPWLLGSLAFLVAGAFYMYYKVKSLCVRMSKVEEWQQDHQKESSTILQSLTRLETKVDEMMKRLDRHETLAHYIQEK